jgi:hypothetical protein
MHEEMTILLEANEKDGIVVEKETHILWDRERLLEAQEAGLYQEETSISPPDYGEVYGLYPGCLHAGAAMQHDRNFCPTRQTKHFVIFERESAGRSTRKP